MKSIKQKNNISLGDRMKSYEELSTSRQLMPNCPVYARLDGRAFHTFCRGLPKPYSKFFMETMQDVCKYLVDETGAVLGYVQSDEISLGWTDLTKAPFEGRIQKLESNLPSMASAKFVQYVYSNVFMNPNFDDGLFDRVRKYLPSFDCRIFNVPTLDELANAFLWRENDAIKNSITGMALSFFSNSQIHKKNSDEKIEMMREMGYDFYKDTNPDFLRGTFFRRVNYMKRLTKDEISKIPQKQLDMLEKDLEGNYSTLRSKIDRMMIPYRLTDFSNRVEVLFGNAQPVLNKKNPTFELCL